MDTDVLVIHAATFQLERVTCSMLMARAVELSRFIGFDEAGITRGSPAAENMSDEARKHGGGVPSMEEGGIIAALQSIGATGIIKRCAKENIANACKHAGLLEEEDYLVRIDNGSYAAIRLPYYFCGSPRPSLVDDYKVDGHNWKMVETMLKDCVADYCKRNPPGCMPGGTSFKLRALHRIENKEIYDRHKLYETKIADVLDRQNYVCEHACAHPWLQRLADRNRLSRAANTVYLLHGTKPKNVKKICRAGLQTRFSLNTDGIYGKGLYFAENSCKASQYAFADNSKRHCIIVCRVVLGRIQTLHEECPARMFPDRGYHSTAAKSLFTSRDGGITQKHDEYIVYDEAACYPEFVVTYKIG